MSELTAKDIEKYKDKDLNALIRLADKYFNHFIRLRDADKPCISCEKGKPEQACHYYSAGNYKMLRYNEINVNGGCLQDNYYKGGNLAEYRIRLIEIVGMDKVLELDRLAAYSKKNPFKWDRMSLIETIKKYREACKKF